MMSIWHKYIKKWSDKTRKVTTYRLESWNLKTEDMKSLKTWDFSDYLQYCMNRSFIWLNSYRTIKNHQHSDRYGEIQIVVTSALKYKIHRRWGH